MAALMGDVFTDPPRFHDRTHSQHYSQSSSHSSSSPSTTTSSAAATRPRTASIHNPPSRPSPSPRRQASATAATPIPRYASSSQQQQQHQQQQHPQGWVEPTPNTHDAQAKHQQQQQQQQQQYHQESSGGASRFPSPPSSASPNRPLRQQQQQQYGVHDTIPTQASDPSSASSSTTSSTSTAATVVPADHAGIGRGIPSPAPDADNNTSRSWRPSHRTVPSNNHVPTVDQPNTPTAHAPNYQQAHQLPPPPQPKVINIRDLHHIQTLVQQDGHPLSASSGTGNGMLTDDLPLQQMRYEISGMPISDIIEMVAALLTKITTTNDLQHDALHRNQVHLRQAEAQARHQEERQRREKEGEEGGGGGRVGRAGSSTGTANGARSSSREIGHISTSGHMSPLSSSVLAFHGKNVPAITILSYLTRIHKYCPTTYEVFLSLLVYFDRMTERVNDMVVKSEEERRRRRLEEQQARIQEREKQAAAATGGYAKGTADDPDVPMRDTPGHEDDNKGHDSDETDSDLADDDDDDDEEMADGPSKQSVVGGFRSMRQQQQEEEEEDDDEQATYFVVDSFNIHRLIIAGVTCASKFFSDVFYTNSRYAKVGGLPLPELNHLELQFLLLNDFRLAVPVEDLEAYATMLVEFYAREVVAQTTRGGGGGRASASASAGAGAGAGASAAE
ncbi:hypothetical protein QBC32DRAFT_165945 [Pseudoneurospora amorphoporcata]|uniref:Cyclin-domain-containing protein n=1 Tax=Pseudoneurospora amorphoporcata TaxID=241081 RepID=A0AAN6NSL5_9PEZI|nr:hypothetical protein QBC32DRAFT_165945 [Pseudoneurospora amorphoporcata]